MKKILIIRAGSTFSDITDAYGNFDEWVFRGLCVGRDLVHVVDIFSGEELPCHSQCLGAVMTGSHSMVTEKPDWSEKAGRWIVKAVEKELPFLGICYGHQLLVQAAGGCVDYHPKGMEIGTYEISLTEESAADPLFSRIQSNFPAHTTHSQTAISLPDGAVRLAESAHDRHHAVRVGSCAWGVQFHPEFSTDIMRQYILKQKDALVKNGEDVEKLLENVKETAQAASVQEIFARFCIEKNSV